MRAIWDDEREKVQALTENVMKTSHAKAQRRKERRKFYLLFSYLALRLCAFA